LGTRVTSIGMLRPRVSRKSGVGLCSCTPWVRPKGGLGLRVTRRFRLRVETRVRTCGDEMQGPQARHQAKPTLARHTTN
jgi:hypothetical protein